MATKKKAKTTYQVSPEFLKICEQAAQKINPNDLELSLKLATKRQASKYRNNTGIVWKTLNNRL